MDDKVHSVTVSRCEHEYTRFQQLGGDRTYTCSKCERDIDGRDLNHIRELEKRIDTLTRDNERLENLLAEGVHTCSNQCERPMCVLRRENRGLREAAQAVVDVYKNYDDTDYFRGSETEVHISDLAKALEQGD